MNRLAEQLRKRGLTVVKAYGGADRVEAERLFQAGEADVYIGGLQTAEGISLNRADACIHIEQDYVPGNMLQAEARAQGVGQKAPRGYLIRTCMNSFGLPEDSDMDVVMAGILSKKIEGLNELYGENESLDSTVASSEDGFWSALAELALDRARKQMDQAGIQPEPKQIQTPIP